MGLIDKVKDKMQDLAEEDETLYHEYECQDCGVTFLSTDPPDEASCDECGSADVTKEGEMYAGGEVG